MAKTITTSPDEDKATRVIILGALGVLLLVCVYCLLMAYFTRNTMPTPPMGAEEGSVTAGDLCEKGRFFPRNDSVACMQRAPCCNFSVHSRHGGMCWGHAGPCWASRKWPTALAIVVLCCCACCGKKCIKRRERIGIGALPSCEKPEEKPAAGGVAVYILAGKRVNKRAISYCGLVVALLFIVRVLRLDWI